MNTKSKCQKLITWYMQMPVLNKVNPISLLCIVLALAMALLFPASKCTCSDQIEDVKLSTIAMEGNKTVIEYQQKKESIVICAARRKALLKQLEYKERPK